jgi:hypothetical protein
MKALLNTGTTTALILQTTTVGMIVVAGVIGEFSDRCMV